MRKPQSYLNTVGYTRILLRDEYNIPDSLIPANNAARLRALEDYQLLETRSEKILDEVVAATARLTALAERTVTTNSSVQLTSAVAQEAEGIVIIDQFVAAALKHV